MIQAVNNSRSDTYEPKPLSARKPRDSKRAEAGRSHRRPTERMRIVVADDDPVSQTVLAAIINGRTQHEVVIVSNGEEALQAATSEPRPDVLLLDWSMPGMSGVEVCRAVRAQSLEVEPHILLITGRRGRTDIVDGLSSGADDLLIKPVAPDLLLARLRLAANRRAPRRHSVPTLVQALVDARSERNGELVVRDGDTTARVFFCEGKVAWAQVSEDRSVLLETLAPDLELDTSAIREVIEECRATGSGLGETLVRWGLVDRARLRDGMAAWLTRKLATIREFQRPRTLFLPGKRRCSRDLLFELEELVAPIELAAMVPSLPPEAASDTTERPWEAAFVAPAAPSPATDEVLDACMKSEGVIGAAVLDRTTGICQGYRGTGLNPEATWAQLRSLNAVSLRARVEDSIVVTDQHFHIVLPLPNSEGSFLYAVVARAEVMLAAARIQLRQLLEHR